MGQLGSTIIGMASIRMKTIADVAISGHCDPVTLYIASH